MSSLSNARDVQSALDAGVDLVNVETGEFYSISRHQALSDRIAGVYGTVSLDALSELRGQVTDEVGSEEFMGLVEVECERGGGRLVPRYEKDGHAISIKEAARVAHASGWRTGHPADVFGEPGIGRASGVEGPFNKVMATLAAYDAQWSASAFAEKRVGLADELSAAGFDPEERGNPLTREQRNYIYDLCMDCRIGKFPQELANLAAAGALSSHEASRVIEAGEKAGIDGVAFSLPKATRLSNFIEARHDDYASRHGGFIPAPERVDALTAYGFDEADMDHDEQSGTEDVLEVV